MSRIELKGINKTIGGQTILRDLDLVIEDGDFMTLLGPSGCGKTTTLRIISGLDNAETGTIAIDGKEVANGRTGRFVHPSRRGLNLVFQSYALWPHMTVFDNVAFGLQVKRLAKADIRAKVAKALDKLKIGHLRDRYPAELSGGQQQRVAIARAIVTEPGILLLDEPLSNLDARLRLDMRAELKRLHAELQTTIVYVTHDQVEALTLSTKVAVFFEGRLVQVDRPQRLYRYPAEWRVADFIGHPAINFVDAVCACQYGRVRIGSALGTLAGACEGVPFEGDAVLAIYPEDIAIGASPERGGVRCIVEAVLPAGAETLVQLSVHEGPTLLAKYAGDGELRTGSTVWAVFPPGKVNVYDKSTGRLIPPNSWRETKWEQPTSNAAAAK